MAVVLRLRHPGAVAILAYGSCLRGVAAADTLMDFYVLTENFSGVSPNIISRVACCIVPPNVYYAETEFARPAPARQICAPPLAALCQMDDAGNQQPLFLGPLRATLGSRLCAR